MNQFSIVIPVKNGGHFLKDCVAAILAQQYPHFTVFILESQSTDGTAEWLQTLTDSRIQVLASDKPLNINENWERILHLSLGEYTTICGQDDILLPNYLTEMNVLIRQHPDASLYQTHFHFIDREGAFRNHCLPMDERQSAPELLASLLAQTLDSMATGYLFRSADYKEFGGIPVHYPDLLFADNEIWISLTAKSYKATSFTNAFAYRHHQSLSRTTGGTNYYRAFMQYLHFLKRIKERDTRMQEVILRYAEPYLYEYCQAVAHRLLKTPDENRSVDVKAFLEECRTFAAELLPGTSFDPYAKLKIKVAAMLDDNEWSRVAFQAFRKLYNKPL